MPILFGNEVSPDVYEANKHLLSQPKAPKTEARKDLDAEIRQRFARQFEATWALCGGPPLEKEVRFCEGRDWRADYTFETATIDNGGNSVVRKYIVELEGGVYMSHGGGHRSKSGYIEDVFKYNAAALLGYKVIRIATGMATATYLTEIIAAITQSGR
jgi:hypothetical protein